MKNSRTRVKPVVDEPTQTLKDIDQEIARLKERAASIIAAEKGGVIERIKEAVAYYGLTATDLGLGGARSTSPPKQAAQSTRPSAKTGARGSAKTAPTPLVPKKPRAGAGVIKFKDEAGNTWSGFGPKPRWLTEALARGKAMEDLKV